MYRRYTCFIKLLLLFLLLICLLLRGGGGLGQEPRRVEGKLFFLPYNLYTVFYPFFLWPLWCLRQSFNYQVLLEILVKLSNESICISVTVNLVLIDLFPICFTMQLYKWILILYPCNKDHYLTKDYIRVEFYHWKNVKSNGKMKRGISQIKKWVIFDGKNLNLFLWWLKAFKLFLEKEQEGRSIFKN